MVMRTVWLNFGVAFAWWMYGTWATPILIPVSLVVLCYSFAFDWHEDSAAYREALAEIASGRRAS